MKDRPPERRDCPFYWEDARWNGANLPVVGVSWFEAEAYCNWLESVTGNPYRLPSEAEWEKAARGPKNFLWPWGNTWDAEKCNSREADEKLEATSPVGMYPHGASPYGALDMAGNVWEWCADRYEENLYRKRANSEVRDPPGPESGLYRMLRGGAWSGLRDYGRCAFRCGFIPGDFGNSLGFRLALSPI